MKIFSAVQIREWDAAAAIELNISSHQLMERAARACLLWINKHLPKAHCFYIFCGTGNNGGDGLALARLMLLRGLSAKAVLLHGTKTLPGDAAESLELLRKSFPGNIIDTDENFPLNTIPKDALLIDALFGTGLSRPLDEAKSAFVKAVNRLSNKKIAIDLPSGLMADKLPGKEDTCITADYTLTFQSHKRSLLHPEAAAFAGDIKVLDIGMNGHFAEKNYTPFFISDKKYIRSVYRPRHAFSHKGTYGTAILIGGSYGKIGAIAMSAKAALRSGAGKVFVQAPECGYGILQSLVPEAMFESAGKDFVERIEIVKDAVIGIGPGFGTALQSGIALEHFLRAYRRPLVLDADALNIIAEQKEKLLPLIPVNSIITPHPKEFERLFGNTVNSMEQTDLAIQKAVEHKIYIVLKGHRTVVCTPYGEGRYNITGNAGMATAGSGDVLTGIITGLLAQKYLPEEAATLGVYLHGASGDLAAKRMSQEAMIAGDLIRFLGKAFLQL